MKTLKPTAIEKLPNPKELEKEIGEFLARKFGGEVKIISPSELPQKLQSEGDTGSSRQKRPIHFDLKPTELIAYLDEYVVRQESAKAILATKICTHFNRIRRAETDGEDVIPVGGIKNNVLMIGPTGVGKTYMIRLIARKLGVPFVKGDATKFSETGYVGGDVEDLVRDLVREADGDIERAQNGIIYIDEIDKIASSQNLHGADVSRTGVQRALLKPMEETEVEMKVAHDPISMIQEIEQFRKTGRRERQTVNTRNILFIMSGAFNGLDEIIRKRITEAPIGFGARLKRPDDAGAVLQSVRSEDLIAFGFESEFIGRLPVRAVFGGLGEADLYEILKNPNNPVILSKKLDFSAYGIQIKFEDGVLRRLARRAFAENTGARGLVSAIESALMPFERSLPSGRTRTFPVTESALSDPEGTLDDCESDPFSPDRAGTFERLRREEVERIRSHITGRKRHLGGKYGISLTPPVIDIVARYSAGQIVDVGRATERIKALTDDIKNIELLFYNNHDINIVLEEDAVHAIIERLLTARVSLDDVYGQLSADFEYGLKLVRDKTGRSRFFITRDALLDPEHYVSDLLQDDIDVGSLQPDHQRGPDRS
jgi:ATP-dependent Clp protease ATP-binding subunit ClpX